jgi:hypothetical protein
MCNFGQLAAHLCLSSMHALLVESLHPPDHRCIARLAHRVGSILTRTVQLKGVPRNAHLMDKPIPHDLQQGEIGRAAKHMNRIVMRVNNEMRAPAGEGRGAG